MSNPSKVDRDVLLQWFSTLDTNTLRKAWRHVMDQQVTSRSIPRNLALQQRRIRLQRRLNVEKALLLFLDRNKTPTTDQWYDFARKLREAQLYSPTTGLADIVYRLKMFQNRMDKQG